MQIQRKGIAGRQVRLETKIIKKKRTGWCRRGCRNSGRKGRSQAELTFMVGE